MRNLKEIFKIIESENIIYEEYDLKKFNTSGIYFKLNGVNPIIAIDSSIVNTNSYISVLSEELGHHFTTQGNLLELSKSYSDKLIKSKKESIARRWGANFLISDEEFIQALYKCINNKYDMCEYFNTTIDILEKKIDSIVNNEIKYKQIKEDFKLHEVQFNSCNI